MERLMGPAIATAFAVIWWRLWRWSRDTVPRLWARSGVAEKEIPGHRAELGVLRWTAVLFTAIAVGAWIVAAVHLVAGAT